MCVGVLKIIAFLAEEGTEANASPGATSMVWAEDMEKEEP